MALLLFAISFTFISCQSLQSKVQKDTNKKIEEIWIKAMDFETVTCISILCDKFEDEAFGQYQSITDTIVINELIDILSNMHQIEPINFDIDTRARIKLISKNDTNTICIGSLILDYNLKFYDTPKSLIDFIEKYVDIEE